MPELIPDSWPVHPPPSAYPSEGNTSALGLKDEYLVLLNKYEVASGTCSPQFPTSSAGVPRVGPQGRSPLRSAPPATADLASLLGKPRGDQGGVPRKEGVGMVSQPSTWFQGKGCFVTFSLNFQRQNRKCPRGWSSSAKSAGAPAPFRRALPTCSRRWPCLEFKATSEFWCLFPSYSFL